MQTQKGRRYEQTSVSLDTSDGVIPVNKILGPSLFSEAAGLVEFLSKMDQQILCTCYYTVSVDINTSKNHNMSTLSQG